jgi:hypothetical protein
MIYVTAMALLIRTNPQVFPESRQLIKEGRPGYGGSPFTSEDLYRAFLLLKFHIRHTSLAKADSNFYISSETGPVAPLRFFTEQEMEDAADDQPPEDEEAGTVHPGEELARAEDDAPDSEPEDSTTFAEQEAQFEEVVEEIEKINANERSAPDPERAGLKDIRPALSRATQRLLCERLAKGVKVLHDEKWSELEPGEEVEVCSQTIV